MLKLFTDDYSFEVEEQKLIDSCQMFKLAKNGKFKKEINYDFSIFPKECLMQLKCMFNNKNGCFIAVEVDIMEYFCEYIGCPALKKKFDEESEVKKVLDEYERNGYYAKIIKNIDKVVEICEDKQKEYFMKRKNIDLVLTNFSNIKMWIHTLTNLCGKEKMQQDIMQLILKHDIIFVEEFTRYIYNKHLGDVEADDDDQFSNLQQICDELKEGKKLKEIKRFTSNFKKNEKSVKKGKSTKKRQVVDTIAANLINRLNDLDDYTKNLQKYLDNKDNDVCLIALSTLSEIGSREDIETILAKIKI